MGAQTFQTKDVYLAAFLSTVMRVQPILTQEGTTVMFCFQDNDQEVSDTIRSYHEGMAVEAYRLIAVIRRLRAAMLNLKHGGSPREA